MALSITQVLNLMQKKKKKRQKGNSKKVSSDAQGNLLSILHFKIQPNGLKQDFKK